MTDLLLRNYKLWNEELKEPSTKCLQIILRIIDRTIYNTTIKLRV